MYVRNNICWTCDGHTKELLNCRWKLLSSVFSFEWSYLWTVPPSVFGATNAVQNSAKIIRASVFGVDENKKVREKFMFPQNNLVVTSIDIQSVEPVDQRTRDSLQKSVQLAIEITTNSQEAAARSVLELQGLVPSYLCCWLKIMTKMWSLYTQLHILPL